MAKATVRSRGTRRTGAVPTYRPARRWNRRWVLLGIAGGLVAIALVIAFGPGGLTRTRPISILSTSDFHTIVFSPTEPNVAYFGHHHGVLRSEDGGRTWKPLVQEPEIDAMGLAFSQEGSGRMLLAGHNGLKASEDGGATWTTVATDLPSPDIHAFTMNPDDHRRLYAFVVARGLFTSADGGETWLRLAGDQPLDVLAIASLGGNPERLFLSSARGGLFRSVDGGATWVSIPSGPAPGPVFSLAAEPRTRTIYAGVSDGLYRSIDGGDTWTKLPYPGKNALSVAVSPLQPQTLLAISMEERRGLVYRSEDGGLSWVR